MRTIAVMKRWIELLQQDFNSEELQVQAATFTEEMRRAHYVKEAEEIVGLLAEKVPNNSFFFDRSFYLAICTDNPIDKKG